LHRSRTGPDCAQPVDIGGKMAAIIVAGNGGTNEVLAPEPSRLARTRRANGDRGARAGRYCSTVRVLCGSGKPHALDLEARQRPDTGGILEHAGRIGIAARLERDGVFRCSARHRGYSAAFALRAGH
jgi:hypothetical protein